jgi:acetyl-CoA synthetase
MNPSQIESISHETRVFEPEFEALVSRPYGSDEDYKAHHASSLKNTEAYWESVAKELTWFKPWDTVFNASEKPFFKWFEGGQTNITHNCIDRQIELGNGNKAAIIWEGEPGESDKRVLTYWDLYREVNQCANAFKKLGLKKGDRAAIYLPMIPELAIATLACARLGIIHTVIFAGFSSNSIKDRVNDCEAKLVITADGGWRRGQILNLKSIVDEAIIDCPSVTDVVIVKRGHGDPFPCKIKDGRDKWYHRITQDQPIHCEAEKMDAEDILFLLYTSGTTGKPKGIIHTTGGYMTYAYHTTRTVFDISSKDVYWCSADIGWITGHSYILYGPLLNGASILMYEGAPNWPDNGRFWELIEKYRVTIFYTAPTAIRAFMKWGNEWPEGRDLSSLRLLGSVGEPINPEAWMWYYEVIGAKRCPIVDTWWQTETGGIMISPVPGITKLRPGSATHSLPGVDAAILDEEGNETDAGLLAIRSTWPGIMRGIWGDEQRYKDTYWCKWNGEHYFPGDGARRDKDGFLWILGRVDDVVNVSGHRIGTAELESIFVGHSNVVEAAVIGSPHEIKGQCLVAFVTLKQGVDADPSIVEQLNSLVIEEIGKFAVPEKIIFAADLPKTRSGKIMRRLLRDIAEGRALGNVTTLADPSVVENLKQRYDEN